MEVKPVQRWTRECGHPADWTMDLKGMDDIIRSYCIGCLMERVGLQPVDAFRIEMEHGKPKIIHVPVR